MLKNAIHEKLLEKLEDLIDLQHIEHTENLHQALWNGEKLPYLPCVSGLIQSEDWPVYRFTECWDDIEKILLIH